MNPEKAKAPWSPYLAGLGVGLTLLASFVVLGSGLGASGAFSRATAALFNGVAPGYTQSHPYWKAYFASGGSPLNDWMIYLIVGVFFGGLIGAVTSGRLQRMVEKGASISTRNRFWLALAGGALSGLGARLARGCTSGQALSGGAQLSLGSWAFMISVFVGGFGLAYFVRREWQ
jgi:uncharacterized membrane protein YedE/YeeE